MYTTVPQDHDSIFGDTYHGVPNPDVPHRHPYPTRYHGGVFLYPQAMLPYVENPYAVPPYAGLGGDCGCGGKCGGCGCGGLGADETPPLLRSVTGFTLGDAALGAGLGYLMAPSKAERGMWTAIGGVATALAGTLGLIGTMAGVVYASKRSP